MGSEDSFREKTSKEVREEEWSKRVIQRLE